MKRFTTILFIFFASNLFGQINPENDWPRSIQYEFNLIKKLNIDTLLVFYSYLGSWTNLPDSCNGIPSYWILWVKNGEYYAKQLFCDSITKDKIITTSSIPIKYFINHIKDFELKNKYLNKNKFLLPIVTDVSWDYLIFMTSKNKIFLNLSEDQRVNVEWKSYAWIKPTIKAIDTTKYELYNKKER